MDILLGILLIALLSLYFAYIRRKPENQARREGAADRRTGEAIDISGGLAGSECIYTDGVEFMKARILQAEFLGEQVQVRLQPVRAEGLSQSPDDTINVEAPTNTLEHSPTYMHAPYVGWKLFMDPQVIARVTELASSSGDLQAIKEVLKEHRMQTVA